MKYITSKLLGNNQHNAQHMHTIIDGEKVEERCGNRTHLEIIIKLKSNQNKVGIK